MFISATAICLLVICAILATYVAVLLLKVNSLQKQKKTLQADFKSLETRISTIEMEELKHKINPHLFKNILNSIQSHAYQTYFSLDKLSNVLDYILYESDRQFVSIREEIEFAMNLIEINKLKLSPLFDINIKNKIPEDNPFYSQELLTPMISADLIENAFKHADFHSKDSFISITFELQDEFFTLTVANKISSKPALKKSHGGIGKVTLKKRLEAVYKNCYQLQQFVEKDIFISHLKINLIEYKVKVFTS